jgi:hypothetical protein
VRRENVHLGGHTESLERLDGFFNNGQVAVTAHDDSDFVQGRVLPENKIGRPHSVCVPQKLLPSVQIDVIIILYFRSKVNKNSRVKREKKTARARLLSAF